MRVIVQGVSGWLASSLDPAAVTTEFSALCESREAAVCCLHQICCDLGNLLSGLHFFDLRQVLDSRESENLEKPAGRAVEHGAAHVLCPADDLD